MVYSSHVYYVVLHNKPGICDICLNRKEGLSTWNRLSTDIGTWHGLAEMDVLGIYRKH